LASTPFDSDALKAAGAEQLAALHNIGRLAAHVGAEKLDSQVGAGGFLTNAIDNYTAAVGRSFQKAGAVPQDFQQTSVPPPTKWIAVAVIGTASVTALLFLAFRPRAEVTHG
jgi:hypothetical protein